VFNSSAEVDAVVCDSSLIVILIAKVYQRLKRELDVCGFALLAGVIVVMSEALSSLFLIHLRCGRIEGHVD
jgi:hypothetical protein